MKGVIERTRISLVKVHSQTTTEDSNDSDGFFDSVDDIFDHQDSYNERNASFLDEERVSEEEIYDESEQQKNLEGHDRWAMLIAKVYERSIEALGDGMGE